MDNYNFTILLEFVNNEIDLLVEKFISYDRINEFY